MYNKALHVELSANILGHAEKMVVVHVDNHVEWKELECH